MDFISACLECAKDDKLINEFCRIKGLKQPERASLMENRFAIVSGYPADCVAAKQFADFIFGYVYAQAGSAKVLETEADRARAAHQAGEIHLIDVSRQTRTVHRLSTTRQSAVSTYSN